METVKKTHSAPDEDMFNLSPTQIADLQQSVNLSEEDLQLIIDIARAEKIDVFDLFRITDAKKDLLDLNINLTEKRKQIEQYFPGDETIKPQMEKINLIDNRGVVQDAIRYYRWKLELLLGGNLSTV